MYTKDFYNKNLKMVARELRNNMTPAENKLWYQFLHSFYPRVRRQRALGNSIVDFYIPKAKLAIEVDGEVHDNETARSKDIDRTMFLNRFGVHVIRFKNEDIVRNFAFVCKTITDEVLLRTKV